MNIIRPTAVIGKIALVGLFLPAQECGPAWGQVAQEGRHAEQEVAEVPAASRPKFTISKETTWITEPLTADGYPDYAAALNQRFGAGVTSENNANVLFWQAAGPRRDGKPRSAEYFKLLGMEPPPEQGNYFLPFEKYLTKEVGLDEGGPEYEAFGETYDNAVHIPWTAAEHPHLVRWLEVNQAPLALIVEGSRRERLFGPPVHDPDTAHPPSLHSKLRFETTFLRDIVRALLVRAMRHLGEGAGEDSWQDLLACHRLERLAGQGPGIVDNFVAYSMNGLAGRTTLAWIAHQSPNPAEVARRLHDLRMLSPIAEVRHSLDVTQRYLFLDWILTVARGRGGPLFEQQEIFAHAAIASVVDWDEALRLGNVWFNRYLYALDEPIIAQRRDRIDEIVEDLRDLPGELGAVQIASELFWKGEPIGKVWGRANGKIYLASLLSAVDGARSAEIRARQSVQHLETAFALAAHHSAEGAYPDRLDRLVPRYLERVPPDLFSGELPIYRSTDAGYFLYSVGDNGRDDDGRYYHDFPRGDDVAIRMPPPPPGDQRRPR